MTKKFISLILALVLALGCVTAAFAASDSNGFGDYKHVYIIGIDGAGAAFEKVDTPNFDRIFAQNAYRYNAHTEYVTVSAQNWGSILCGVAYDVHGFTNGYIGDNERSSDSDNGSIFRYVRQAMPDAELVSFCNWEPISHGIIENDLNVKKYHRSTDPLVAQAIVHYLNQGNEPTLMFVQFDSVDHAAHSSGGFSKQYYKAVEKADRYIGEIYDALEKNGLIEDSLFIVVADHGETTDGHGGQTVEESSAVVAVAGKSVDNIIIGENIRNRDVAAIALYALGIEKPAHMTAVVPDGLFGKTVDKTVAPLEINGFVKFFRGFCNVFVKAVNLIICIFE